MIGFNLRFDDYLNRTEVFYVNLNEVPYVEQDPLVSLMSESDLLSQGLEQKHMGAFS